MPKFLKKRRRRGEWRFTQDSGKWKWHRHINGQWVDSSTEFDTWEECLAAARRLGYRG